MPWEIIKSEREQLDALINCIRIPKGKSSEFEVTNPFQQTDVLKMRGCLHIGTTLMELIVHWTSFDVAYKSYCLMLSKDLQSLGRPIWPLDQTELNELELRMYELISVKEGIFPMKTHVFINHQMVDLTQGVRLFGSIMNMNGFAGERIGGMLKYMLNKGGKYPEKACMERYDALERDRIKLAYSRHNNKLSPVDNQFVKTLNPPSNISRDQPPDLNHVTSTDFRIRLYQKSRFNVHQKLSDKEVFDILHECRLYIISKVHGTEQDMTTALSKSSLCICWFIWQKTNIADQIKVHEHETFFHWLQSEMKRETFRTILCPFNTDSVLTMNVPCIIRLVRYLKGLQSYYKRAQVYGLSFCSRGMHCRSLVNDDINVMRNSWGLSTNMSTWCKGIDYKSIITKKSKSVGGVDNANYDPNFGHRTMDSRDQYMQANGYFRMHCPNEHLLHDVPFVSVTTRLSVKSRVIDRTDLRRSNNSDVDLDFPDPSQEVNFLEHVIVQDDDLTLDKCTTFFPCAYLYSTSVLILPCYKPHFVSPLSTDTSIAIKLKLSSAKPFRPDNLVVANEFAKYYAQCESSDISFLTFIDLHPSRCYCYKYAEDYGAHDCFINTKKFDY